MAIIRTNQKQIEDYYNTDAVSQSLLKSFLNGLNGYKSYIANKDKEKSYLSIGSAVDCILTQGEEEFKKQFYVSELENSISETEKTILNEIFENAKLKFISLEQLTDKEFTTSLAFQKWQPKWKTDTKIDKIKKVCKGYYDELYIAENKTILSKEEFATIEAMVYNLRNSSVTKEYFDKGLYYQKMANEEDHLDIYYQLPIYFEHRNVKCKALLDIVVVDNARSLVIPLDIKTTSKPILEFEQEIYKYRYDIQASFYNIALNSVFTDLRKNSTFGLIVSSTQEPQFPMIYKLGSTLVDVGKNGKKSLVFKGRQIRKQILGFEQLLDEYLYYVENGFEVDRRITKNNGIISIESYL